MVMFVLNDGQKNYYSLLCLFFKECISHTIARFLPDKTVSYHSTHGGKYKAHNDIVSCLIISVTEAYIISGSFDHTLKCYSVVDGKLKKTFGEHRAWVHCVALSKNGRTLYSGGSDNIVISRKVKSEELNQKFIGHEEAVTCCVVNNKENYLFSGSADRMIFQWEIEGGAIARKFRGHRGIVTCLILTHCNRFLYSSSYDKTIRAWDVSSGKPMLTMTGHRGPVKSIVLNSNNSEIFSASYDHTVKRWGAKNGNLLQTFSGHTDYVYCLALSPTEDMLYSGSDDCSLRLWDIETGKCTDVYQGNTSVRCCGTSKIFPNDFVFYGGTFGELHSVKTNHWNEAVKKIVDEKRSQQVEENPILDGHGGSVTCCAISPNGVYVVTGSDDKVLLLWDSGTGKLVSKMQGHSIYITCCKFSLDSKVLYSGSADKDICIWDLESVPKKTNRVCSPYGRFSGGHDRPITCLALHPNGQSIFSGSSDNTLIRWDCNTNSSIKVYDGHILKVKCCLVSNNGRFLFSASEDKTIIIWNIETGEITRKITGAKDISTLANVFDQHIVSGSSDGKVEMWNINTGKSIKTFNTLRCSISPIKNISFTAETGEIVTAQQNGDLTIFHYDTNKIYDQRFIQPEHKIGGNLRCSAHHRLNYNEFVVVGKGNLAQIIRSNVNESEI